MVRTALDLERVWKELLEKRPAVSKYSRRLISDRPWGYFDKDDIVQEAFLGAWRTLMRGVQITHAGAFLKACAQHAFSRMIKQGQPNWKERCSSMNRGDVDAKAKEEQSIADPNQESEAQRIMMLAISEVMKKLPDPDDREIMALKIEGFSSEEIAVRVGKTVGAINTRVHRIRQWTKQQLRHVDE